MAAMKNLLIEVLELTEKGYSVEFIAGVTGLQPYVVEYVVAEYGVQPTVIDYVIAEYGVAEPQ